MAKNDKEKIEATEKEKKNTGFEYMVNSSEKFKKLKQDCIMACKLSLTGLTNLIVNYEDPCLVDAFINSCFLESELYKGTYNIDAVELQQGRPGLGFAARYIDNLIYGTMEEETDANGNSEPKTDSLTGKRQRNPDGFVNRKEVLDRDGFQDRLLVIKNIDYCMDFCQTTPGLLDARSLWIFDNFRNPSIKKGCRILLVTNEPLKFPFKTRSVTIDPVDEFEAKHIIAGHIKLFQKGKYIVEMNENQKRQVVRKISGLTYTEAADALGESFQKAILKDKTVDSVISLKKLREKINRNFMEDAVGLTHLTARPWEDYICPKSSNFTYDVKKIVRDFEEIEAIKKNTEKILKDGGDDTSFTKNAEAIRQRMPHVIILYGKGGVGKCLKKGTPVLMFDGKIKKVEDIKVGELLMGPDYKPRTVLTTNSGTSQLYRVEQNNGDSYACNGAHILSLKKELPNSQPFFISVEDYIKKSESWKKDYYGWKSIYGLQSMEKPIIRLSTVVNVSQIGEGEYFGFTIDGDHQFLLGDFTVTHNSAFPIHFAGLLDFDVWDFNVTATHSKWIGEGPDRMREAINKISKTSHVIIRIDEYDRGMGATGDSGNGMHEAHKQVEAEFMNWLQNAHEENLFIKNDIFLILTTNHKENITGPLLRSGRADLVIDIADFDRESMREAFVSAPRRMTNRGIFMLGFKSVAEFEGAVSKLDIDALSEMAQQKGFTVRDVDTLLQEMASHNYYFMNGKEGLAWNNESFVKVMEGSTGSVKGENTCELVLGDRFVMSKKEEENSQKVFDFYKECDSFNLDRFKEVNCFKE